MKGLFKGKSLQDEIDEENRHPNEGFDEWHHRNREMAEQRQRREAREAQEREAKKERRK